MGRDATGNLAQLISDVSIHAPAWGATECFAFIRKYIEVSIHAPAWGATNLYFAYFMHYMFQSTRPRGARHGRKSFGHVILCFNPRARVGRDCLCGAAEQP